MVSRVKHKVLAALYLIGFLVAVGCAHTPERTPANGEPSLRIVRSFDVPPEIVFDVFTDPDEMPVWWGPGVTFEIDLRVGGRWKIIREAGDTTYTATGVYQVVERPFRLEYTYAMPQFSPNSDLISIEITSDANGSQLTFVQSGVDIAQELRQTPEGEMSASESGWRLGFDLMAAAWARQP